MTYAVKTTHAVPVHPATLHLVKKNHLLVCVWCGSTLGRYCTADEREILEACHACEAKMLDLGPVASVPFN
jgi:tRNA G26 N,N-dimethylase Trm1